MEFMMVIGSMFIWKRVTEALNHLDPDKITPARFRWRTICFQDVARATLFILYIINSRHAYTYLSLFCALLFVLGGLYATLSDPVYTRVSIPLRNLHNGDVKVVLLTDLHIGPTVGQKRMQKIVELTNRLNPDIVAISGDLADGFVKDLEGAANPLCSLKSKHGVYFATGNHEYMHGNVDEWFAYLERCNVTVLHNSQQRILMENGDRMCIAGTDDLFAARAHFPGHGMDAQRAVVGCHPGDAVVMLAHQPNAAQVMLDDPIVSKRVDLILSGHTHGGQMYLFVPVIYLVNAFARGLYYNEPTGVYVYVSAGVNYFGPPIKMFGACEIIDITLKPVI
ncbi:Ser/Thr phosphatase family protein [Ancylostoma ceylanicum]|uniref:Ser/Thr phosphatase family protein n=1 Tax=Ancylostoma ceylanicum TaxID=53326 RepID=A0A0D6M2B6_9BILA|nr:Ser/Thr phosphatase family protein [Ancylostoma ceylanicum]